MDIRAIAFDLDDTMLRDDRTLSPYTVRTLRRAAAMGVHVIPASGRARDSMKPFVDELGCASCYIACNGAEIRDPAHALLRSFVFPDPVAQRIIAFARAHGSYAQTYWDSRFHYLIDNEFARAYASLSLLHGTFTPDMEAFVAAHPTGKILVMDSEERVAAMLAEARECFAGEAAITCSKPWFLEFNPAEATKGNALKACGELLGFAPDQALAFGDSLNDVSMLLAAGLGVAVANAREDVKSQVPAVCGPNNEDGPARFIRRQLSMEEDSL